MSSSPADGGALQIFINRRPVDAAAALGLAAGGSATGADIAGLAGIPADNAVVEWQAGPDDIRPGRPGGDRVDRARHAVPGDAGFRAGRGGPVSPAEGGPAGLRPTRRCR